MKEEGRMGGIKGGRDKEVETHSLYRRVNKSIEVHNLWKAHPNEGG